MASVNKGTITFDQGDWLAGINPAYLTGLTDVPAPQVGKGLGEAIRFNPFRYLGYASPGFDPTDVTNVSVVTTGLKNIAMSVESSTNYGYLISSGDRLHRLDVANKSLSSGGSWPRTIAVTGAITGQDVAAYTSNVSSTATPCVFYSFNDAGGSWNVGRFITASGAFDDDFFSTVPATPITPTGNTKPHPMVVGSNDILYIGDGNLLQAYNGRVGADGTDSSAVLTLPQGYIITSFSRISQPTPFLVIYAYYSPAGNTITANSTSSGPAKAFFYDYFSLDPTYIIDLDDRIVTAGFDYKGTVGCFTQGNNLVNDGANRFSRLKIWNGAIFETAIEFIGNAPNHGGVDIVGDSIQWNYSNGSVCNLGAYGSPFAEIKAGFNIIGAGAGNTPGVLRTIGGSTGFQLISSGTTTSGGLQYMKTATYAGSSSVRTITVAPEFGQKKKGIVDDVTVEFAKTSASTGAQLDVFLVYENSQSTQIISSLAEVTASNLRKTYTTSIANVDGDLPEFIEMGVLLRWVAGSLDTDAPIVRRVSVAYSEKNIND